MCSICITEIELKQKDSQVVWSWGSRFKFMCVGNREGFLVAGELPGHLQGTAQVPSSMAANAQNAHPQWAGYAFRGVPSYAARIGFSTLPVTPKQIKRNNLQNSIFQFVFLGSWGTITKRIIDFCTPTSMAGFRKMSWLPRNRFKNDQNHKDCLFFAAPYNFAG